MPGKTDVTIKVGDLPEVRANLDHAARLISTLSHVVGEADALCRRIIADGDAPAYLRAWADSWSAAHCPLPSILDAADCGHVSTHPQSLA